MSNVYFSGIGGVGIGPLAQITRDAGYDVQGSDVKETLMTKELREQGIAVHIGQDGGALQAAHDVEPIDWFIYTAALPADHPELVLAQKLGIRTAKRDELLAHIIKEKGLKLIAVAGTSGKTTTTSMLVWAFIQQGIPVSYSIGTTISFGPSGKFDPKSEFFIYECDEFDRNFLHFSPYLALVTSIHYDHQDIYPTPADYMGAFRQFIRQSDTTLLWQRDNEKIEAKGDTLITLEDSEILPVSVGGLHNKRNATLVVRAMEQLKLAEPRSIVESLGRFPGSDRRFEKLADNLYTDYAVIPPEIAATLQRAHETTDHIVAVYQPHQNIRQYEARRMYTDCFNLAEKVYWLPTFLVREDPSLAVLTPQELTQNLENKNVEFADLDDALWSELEQERQAGKLVLVMGAGTIDKWARDKAARL